MLASGWRSFQRTPGPEEPDYPFPQPAVNAGALPSNPDVFPPLMRFLIVLSSMLLIPVLVIAHLWIYDMELKPELANRALRELKRIGIKHSNVRLDYMDATITGTAVDAEMRDAAGRAMRAVSGIHFDDARNLIVVPARVEAEIEGSQLTLSGWLPDEKSVQALLRIVGEFRPDLKPDARKLRVSPFVSAGIDGTQELTGQHRLVRPILAGLRTQPSFSIEKSGDTYVVKGALPSVALKEAVIEATQNNPGGWTVDTSALIGAPHVLEAAFTKSNALALFLKSYFSAPLPGTFSINPDGGPRIVAGATREMEAEWLGLLRGVSGAAKVEADLTIYPSVYLLPGYRPQSEVVEGTLAPLVDALKQTAVYFDPVTNLLPPDEETKLAALLPLLSACGPGLQIVLSGTGGSATETKAAHHARSEIVKTKLAGLGLPSGQLEVLDLGALYAKPPPETDPVKQSSARVEMLVR